MRSFLAVAFLGSVWVLGDTASADRFHRDGHDHGEHRRGERGEPRGPVQVMHSVWHGGRAGDRVAPVSIDPGYVDPGDVEIYNGYADPTFIDPGYVVTPRVMVRARVSHRDDLRR